MGPKTMHVLGCPYISVSPMAPWATNIKRQFIRALQRSSFIVLLYHYFSTDVSHHGTNFRNTSRHNSDCSTRKPSRITNSTSVLLRNHQRSPESSPKEISVRQAEVLLLAEQKSYRPRSVYLLNSHCSVYCPRAAIYSSGIRITHSSWPELQSLRARNTLALTCNVGRSK